MTLLMTPVSFDGVTIDGSGSISAMAFRLPAPTVLSKITRTAGGYILDLDYGEDADLVPAPFGVRFYFEAATAAALKTAVESLLYAKIGNSGTFIAKAHGSATTYSCTAQMQAPSYTVSGRNLGPNTTRLSNIPVTFVPTDLFTAV